MDAPPEAQWSLELGPVVGGVLALVRGRELAERLAHYFGSAPPAPADAPESPSPAAGGEALAVEPQGAGFVLTGLPRDPHQSAKSFADLVERLDADVDEIVAGRRAREHLVLHASAVEEPSGRALLFLGRSLAGKSTTATLAALGGSALLGDECLALALDPEPRVLRWRRPLALREDVLAEVERAGRWSAAERDEVLATQRKRWVPATSLARRNAPDSLPLGRIALLDRAAEDGPADPGAVFRELLAACHYFQRDGHVLFGRLAALARSIPCSTLRPGADVVERLRALAR